MQRWRLQWNEVDLHGSGNISKVVGTYEVYDTRLPAAGFYEIRVIQTGGLFVACPNIRFRLPNGQDDGECGTGTTEVEALQNALLHMSELIISQVWSEGDLEWIEEVVSRTVGSRAVLKR